MKICLPVIKDSIIKYLILSSFCISVILSQFQYPRLSRYFFIPGGQYPDSSVRNNLFTPSSAFYQQNYGQQNYVQPNYVQPNYVQSNYVQPNHVQPNYGQSYPNSYVNYNGYNLYPVGSRDHIQYAASHKKGKEEDDHEEKEKKKLHKEEKKDHKKLKKKVIN